MVIKTIEIGKSIEKLVVFCIDFDVLLLFKG